MAYKYRILSGSVLLGLLGLAAYSVAHPGHYEGAPTLIGDYHPKLMSNDLPEEIPTEEDKAVDEDESIEERQEEIDLEEEEVVFDTDQELPAPAVVTEDKQVEEKSIIEPKEEQSAASVNEESNVVVNAEDKGVVDTKPEKEAPVKDSKKTAEGEKSKNPSTGKSVSKGPLTVNQNPDNKGKYTGYALGQQWGDRLLDTSNARWWVTNEKHFVTKFQEHQMKTQEFRNMWKGLKNKKKSELDGSSLMKLCESHYQHQYLPNFKEDPYVKDIWNTCLKGNRTKNQTAKKAS